MVVLVDTNVLIDYLTARQPFYNDARNVMKSCAAKLATGYVALISIANIFYILRKQYTRDERLLMLREITSVLTVTGAVHDKVVSAIINPEIKDFEDCLQVKCAEEITADYIVTRDISDFANSSVKAISSHDFLAMV